MNTRLFHMENYWHLPIPLFFKHKIPCWRFIPFHRYWPQFVQVFVGWIYYSDTKRSQKKPTTGASSTTTAAAASSEAATAGQHDQQLKLDSFVMFFEKIPRWNHLRTVVKCRVKNPQKAGIAFPRPFNTTGTTPSSSGHASDWGLCRPALWGELQTGWATGLFLVPVDGAGPDGAEGLWCEVHPKSMHWGWMVLEILVIFCETIPTYAIVAGSKACASPWTWSCWQSMRICFRWAEIGQLSSWERVKKLIPWFFRPK